jgi:indolepyruvate ferredoxin oxidoreductase beta subunit
MKFDIILCGVGGQGILSVAAIIAQAAMDSGLHVRQSEVHGMAQRGGEVQAHLRISDGEIPGDLIGRGRASMILGMEPLESLRYIPFLRPDGIIVTSEDPEKNIPDYPDPAGLLKRLEKATEGKGRTVTVPTGELARQSGSLRSANMVLVGAASLYLPVDFLTIKEAVRKRFKSRGRETVEANLKALETGRSAADGAAAKE